MTKASVVGLPGQQPHVACCVQLQLGPRLPSPRMSRELDPHIPPTVLPRVLQNVQQHGWR